MSQEMGGERLVDSTVHPASSCDRCKRKLGKKFSVYWLAGAAGLSPNGDPFIGAMTRVLVCASCSRLMQDILRRAWGREADRIARRNELESPEITEENCDTDLAKVKEDKTKPDKQK